MKSWTIAFAVLFLLALGFLPATGQESGWTLTENFRIGAAGGSEAELFTDVLTGVNLGPDGNIYVIDFSTSEIRVFDRRGDHVRTIGGHGEGPGELHGPSWVGWDGMDRLWTVNAIGGRYTVFDTTGQLIKTVPGRRRSVSRFLSDVHFPKDGTFIDHEWVGNGVAFIRRDTLGQVVDTIVRVPYGSQPSTGPLFRYREDTKTAIRNLLPRLRWTIAPDGSIWFAWTDEYRIVQVSPAGDTLKVITSDHRPAEFSPAEARVVARASREVDEEFSPVVLQDIHVLDDGYVLIQIPDEMNGPGSTFDVFGPQGQFVGTMEWPFAPTELSEHAFRGDTVLAITLDEWDVPYVVHATLRR